MIPTILTDAQAQAAYEILAENGRRRHDYTNRQRSRGTRSFKFIVSPENVTRLSRRLGRLKLACVSLIDRRMCTSRFDRRMSHVTIYTRDDFRPQKSSTVDKS